MEKRPHPCEYIFHARESRDAAGVNVVPPAYGKGNPITCGDNDTGRPDLHIKLVHLTGRQGLLFVVGMIGTVLRGESRIEFAMRCPEPALTDRGMGIERPREDDLLQIRGEHAQHEEGNILRSIHNEPEVPIFITIFPDRQKGPDAAPLG